MGEDTRERKITRRRIKIPVGFTVILNDMDLCTSKIV
jgi:hypothetical protein